MRWSPKHGVSVFREPSDYANGQTRDLQGRLISCHHASRCLTRLEADGTLTTLATVANGKRLNAPNDVVVKSDGSIWFSDPLYGLLSDYEGGRQLSEQPPALYRLDPDSGEVSTMATDFDGPNGLAFSPDELKLYVAESGAPGVAEPRQCIRVFDVAADGRSLSGGEIFHKVTPGWADGFRVDEAGNLWCGAADGVHCIAADGTLLGKVLVPHRVSNLCFGDRHHSRLFLCASTALYALFTNTRGAQSP
jgi:gluconolactonase